MLMANEAEPFANYQNGRQLNPGYLGKHGMRAGIDRVAGHGHLWGQLHKHSTNQLGRLSWDFWLESKPVARMTFEPVA